MANFLGGPGCTAAEVRRRGRFYDMTGGRNAAAPTPLMELFNEIAVPLNRPGSQPHLRVWHDFGTGWHASWGTGGSVGGTGATPEDAILAAHENFIRLRERNALKHRVASVKREHKVLSRKK